MFPAFIVRAALVGALGCVATSAFAQENVMKVCGDKWQAAKAANATAGQTWPQFLAKCRAEQAAAAKPADGAAAKPAAKAPEKAAEKPAPSSKTAVFPTVVSSKYSTEKPARARLKTCSDQFKANKASDANGGLKWIQKGGGYWSQCNKRLKETRA